MRSFLLSVGGLFLASGAEDKLSLLQGKIQSAHRSNSKKGQKGALPGTQDPEGYQKHVKAFIGLNPKLGAGSGFVVRDMKENSHGIVPASDGDPQDLCTCDCKAADDGIGCSGYAGNLFEEDYNSMFRYNSMLWIDPVTEAWNGQMEGWQPEFKSSKEAFGHEYNFLGQDERISPGGPVIYNVACTQADCGDYSGTFRQSNGPVSCSAALAEDTRASYTDVTWGYASIVHADTCYDRCVNKANSGLYKEWLEYCKADTEDVDSGFSGYHE